MEKVNWIRKEFHEVKRAAELCNRNAMYELATRHLTGRDCIRNPEEGIYWACRAANRKHPKAMVLAGYCLIRGIGCSKEPSDSRIEEAVGWFEDAARLGNASAYYNLGGCYLLGIGKPRSKRAALVYYKASSKMGCKRAEQAILAVTSMDAKALIRIADTVQLFFTV